MLMLNRVVNILCFLYDILREKPRAQGHVGFLHKREKFVLSILFSHKSYQEATSTLSFLEKIIGKHWRLQLLVGSRTMKLNGWQTYPPLFCHTFGYTPVKHSSFNKSNYVSALSRASPSWNVSSTYILHKKCYFAAEGFYLWALFSTKNTALVKRGNMFSETFAMGAIFPYFPLLSCRKHCLQKQNTFSDNWLHKTRKYDCALLDGVNDFLFVLLKQ